MRRFFFLTALLAAFLLGWSEFDRRYAVVNGKVYRQDVTVLVLDGVPEDAAVLGEFPGLRWVDLRGHGIAGEDWARMAEAVPGCRIAWELDFQGERVPWTAKRVQVEHLAGGEAAQLKWLPRLREIDASECRDYGPLLALAEELPGCRVHYNVELGGTCWACEEKELAPGACRTDEIRAALALLPQAERMDLRGTGISQEEAIALCDGYPGIRFLWQAELGGVAFDTDAAEIDLSGVAMEDSSAVEALIPYLPELKKVIMCDCGIPSEEMAVLNDRWPDIRFVWRVKLGPLSARTDDTWFAPITHHQLIGGHDVDELKYCTDMECIDLGHCWIRDCEWARGMENLQYLVLADSQVRDLSPLSGLKNLRYLELFVTPVKDYSPLLGCTGLEDLNLGYTTGDPTPIAQMTWLKNLWWGGISHVPWPNGQNPAALLQSGLPNTRVTLYAGSSTGLGWRKLAHYYEMRDRIGMYYMNG